MGKTKTYFLTTMPLEEENFFEWSQKQSIIKDWKCEPDDKQIFENDDTYKVLLKDYFKAKKDLDNYKHKKRNEQ